MRGHGSSQRAGPSTSAWQVTVSPAARRAIRTGRALTLHRVCFVPQSRNALSTPRGSRPLSVKLAVPVALYVGAAPSTRRWTAASYWLGIVDLVNAVALGFLTAPGRFQLLALDELNRGCTYPLVAIPAFGVPLSVLLQASRAGSCAGGEWYPSEPRRTSLDVVFAVSAAL